MSGFFRNTDPPPRHRPAIVYPPAFGAGGGHTRWVERGVGGSIVRKTPDTALYSIYGSTYFVKILNCEPIQNTLAERMCAVQRINSIPYNRIQKIFLPC